MKRILILTSIGLILFLQIACVHNNDGKKMLQTSNQIKTATDLNHGISSENTSKICNCPVQFELKDSLDLTHIKNQFYKSKTGHLYEKTVAVRELNGHLTDVEYFNGYFSQQVDPLTFETLEGWYAKDKSNVYYYRPVSGGMQISKIDNADPKTFKILSGHIEYAQDKDAYYHGLSIIQGFVPNKTKEKTNNKGEVIFLKSDKKTFKLEL